MQGLVNFGSPCVFIRFYAVFKPYNKLFICQMIFFVYEYHSGYAKI